MTPLIPIDVDLRKRKPAKPEVAKPEVAAVPTFDSRANSFEAESRIESLVDLIPTISSSSLDDSPDADLEVQNLPSTCSEICLELAQNLLRN
jgi:hypothetical protein